MESERLVAIELKVGLQERRIEALEKETHQLHSDLAELKSLLVNIKWWLYGIGTFYVISEVGLTMALKKYLGIG